MDMQQGMAGGYAVSAGGMVHGMSVSVAQNTNTKFEHTPKESLSGCARTFPSTRIKSCCGRAAGVKGTDRQNSSCLFYVSFLASGDGYR